MKLTIDGQEVEIKVKDNNGKVSTVETMSFLNNLSLTFYHASLHLTGNGWIASAKACEKCRSDIYTVLEQNGFYSELEQD